MNVIQKAMVKFACLMKDESDYWKEHIARDKNDPTEMVGTDWEDIPKEVKEEYEKKGRAIERYSQELMADPLFFDVLSVWMTDVTGNDLPEDFCEKIVKSGDFKNIPNALSESSNAVSTLRQAIKNWGFIITDSGGGCGGWHLGIPGTESESRAFCSMMHKHFGHWIQEGFITLRRKWWGKARFSDIYNWPQAENFLEEMKEMGEWDGRPIL